MLILLIFLAELAAAILAFIFREHVSCLSIHNTANSCRKGGQKVILKLFFLPLSLFKSAILPVLVRFFIETV